MLCEHLVVTLTIVNRMQLWAKSGIVSIPLGWPYVSLHGSQGFSGLLRGQMDARSSWRKIRSDGVESDMIAPRRLRPLSLACRFDHFPSDIHFVQERTRRLMPLRQLSPPCSLEAGNLRGGFRVANGSLDWRRGFLDAMASAGRWDFATIPVPAGDLVYWLQSAEQAGMGVLARRTGRIYSAQTAFRSWEQLLAVASGNLRRNVKRARRNALEASVTVSCYYGENLAAGLARLRQCALGSWKARPRSNVPILVPLTERQQAIIAELDRVPGCKVIVTTIEAAGKALAAQSWTKYQGTLVAGVTFYLPEARTLSPGHLMVAETLECELMAGVHLIDFNATAAWTAPYANETAEFLTLLIFPQGLTGRALHALAQARDPGVKPDELSRGPSEVS